MVGRKIDFRFFQATVHGMNENSTQKRGDRDGRRTDNIGDEDEVGADSDRRIPRRGDFDPAGDPRIDEVGTGPTSIRCTGRIVGAVFPVWVMGGTRGDVEVRIARSPRGGGGDGDLPGAYPSRPGALAVRPGTRAEVDRRSERGMDGGPRS